MTTPAGLSPASPTAREVEDQLRAIESLTDAAAHNRDVDDLLTELLGQVAKLMRVDTAVALLLDDSAQQLVARVACGIEEEVRQGVRIAVGQGFAGRVAATRQPVMLDRVDSTTVANPLLWEKGLRAMLGVPLVSGNQLIGVLHVGSRSNRRFTEAEANLLARVADGLAAAIQARQLEVERAAAKVVQRSLLPARLPRVPEIEFATRYVAAEVGGVGGDWYDAFVLANGDLWVMVGDVVGHGMRAAVVMGRLRSTLRAYAIEEYSPEEVLTRADRKLQLFEPGETATVLCALLKPPYHSMQLALAGHPPPVMAAGEAPAVIVDAPPQLLLGVDPDTPRTSVTVPLAPGSVVVAYTDGLVERPRESIDDRLELLRQAVLVQRPEQLCFRIMEALVGNETPHDDIAVLVLQRRGTDAVP